MSATLTSEGGRPGVRLERVLAHPPEVVWRALTQPDELARWFPCGVVVEGGTWRVGARLEFRFPAGVAPRLTGEVLVADEPRALAYTWGDETLRYELHEVEGGTRLVLLDLLEPPHAARNAAGWEDCLERLGGRTPSPRAWRDHFDAYRARFEPSLGVQQGPPEGFEG